MKYSLLACLLCSGIAGFAQKAGKKTPASAPAQATNGVYAVAASTVSPTAAGSSVDTTYLSSSDFSGTGTVSDPIRIKTSVIQTWLQSLPGYTAGGDKYLASDFTWKTIATTSGGGTTTTSPDVILFDLANAYHVQQHPDGPGTYYSSQGSGLAKAVKKIAAGSDGLVYFQYLSGSGELLSLGYTSVNALQGNQYWTGGLILTETEVKAYGYNGSTVSLGIAPVNNRYYGFRRNGSAIEIVTSTDASSWTVLGRTNYLSDDLYIQVYFQTTTEKIKVLGQNLVSY